MINKLLKDNNGKPSSTRIILYVWTGFIMGLAIYSIYTGNDMGSNTTDLLKNFSIGFNLGLFGKLGMENLKKND